MSRRQPHTFQEPQDALPLFWKSIEEKNNPEAHKVRAETEFPNGEIDLGQSAGLVVKQDKTASQMAADPNDTTLVGRRGFMMMAGMTAALAAEGCARRPVEKILPYARPPEYVLPGVANHFATVRHHRGEAIGLIVESHEGRPTKIEGNPEHPGSLGATDLITQASIFDLYDPDRSTSPMRKGQKANWAEFESELSQALEAAAKDGGARLRVLIQPTNSPTLVRVRDAFLKKYPQARVYAYAPVSEGNAHEGTKLAFGSPMNALHNFADARVILSLDSDFLMTEPGNVRATRSFAYGRRLRTPNEPMNRLYAVESTHSVTGANADHRLRLASKDIGTYALALAAELGKQGVDLGPLAAAAALAKVNVPEKWLTKVAKDIVANRGRAVVVAGSRQPAHVHAIAAALNVALGGLGRTVMYTPTVDATAHDWVTDMHALTKELNEGKVDALVMVGGNPAFDAPADLKFADALAKAKWSAHVSSHMDETCEKVTWHLPLAHELESWGDQRSLDGVASIQQPLIAPLHGGRSAIDLLGFMSVGPKATAHELVRETWREQWARPVDFDHRWAKALHRGLADVPPARMQEGMSVKLADLVTALSSGMAGAKASKPISADNMEVTFGPDPKLFDGRHANNPWLLELPDPMTKMVWDNAAYVSPATAQALGVGQGDLIRIAREGVEAIVIPAWILPGQADHSIHLNLGWGRKNAGRYGNGHGFNVYPLRAATGMFMADGVKVTRLSGAEVDAVRATIKPMGLADRATPPFTESIPTDPFETEARNGARPYRIVQTQEHHSMEGRPVAIDANLEEYQKTPTFPQYRSTDPRVLPLWRKVAYTGHKWGLSIDLNACTGCNACAMACIAENNVAAVGKEQVARGREMHWIRVDRYFLGDDVADPKVAVQPVMCVHCEEAPCENVCPVNATEHSPEGLNDMAYNRCVGTRYCANNCPYKVRRFNFLNWHREITEVEKMVHNPDVSVRMRGVMEKCTYCVQRISQAKIQAKADARRAGKPVEIKDGDIKTACQQTCPADAITFGNILDPESKVSKLKKQERNYAMLAELNVKPRTTYLAKLRNPNPELA